MDQYFKLFTMWGPSDPEVLHCLPCGVRVDPNILHCLPCGVHLNPARSSYAVRLLRTPVQGDPGLRSSPEILSIWVR